MKDELKKEDAAKDGEIMVVDPEELEKSWDESVSRLKDILQKSSKKASKKEDDDADAEDDAEDEDTKDEAADEEEGSVVKKSLSDLVSKENEEAEIAMDVEPFLKGLVQGMQQYLDQELKTLKKSISVVLQLSKAQAGATVKMAALQKAIDGKVQRIGEETVPSNSVLRKGSSSVRFKKEEKGADSYDRNEVLRKSFSLLRERKITPVQATKIEGRLNKGLVLPAELAHFFDEEGK